MTRSGFQIAPGPFFPLFSLFKVKHSATLTEASLAVSNWAMTKLEIKRVAFFGSRVRRTNRESSDLDIAIELIYADPNSSFAHWAFKSIDWACELGRVLPWAIDLQLYHGVATPTIQQGLAKSSIEVFIRVE